MFCFVSLCVFIIALETCNGKIVKEGNAILSDSSLRDVTFANDLILETKESSMMGCAATCLRARSDPCVTFTFTSLGSSSGTCRLHSQWLNGCNSTDVALDTMVLHMVSIRLNTGWVYSNCSNDNDCPPSINSICFSGQCRCEEGYFLSESTGVCVFHCSEGDLRNTYMEYPMRAITNGDLECSSPGTETSEMCMARCSNSSDCLSIDFNRGLGWGCTQAVTPLSQSLTFYSEWSYYQRSCV